MTRNLAWGLLAACVVAGWAGATALLWPVIFGGLMWPLLALLAPDEPAPLKLAYFAVLLSPPAALVAWGLAELLGFGSGGVLLMAAPLFAGALLVRRSQARHEPLGTAQRVALGVGLLFAGWVAWTLLGSSLARLSFHGLLHSAIVEAVGAGMPPENPWLAGADLGYYWVWHALGAVLVDWLGLAPTRALAVLNVWAAATLPLGAYFWTAGLRGRGARLGARDLIGMGLVLVGLNLLGGFAWLARGAALETPSSLLEVLAGLRELVVLDVDPRVAWAPSKFANASSYPVALALLVGGLLAGSHSLESWRRRGLVAAPDGSNAERLGKRIARTWGLLAALALGASFAFNPLVGAVGLGAVGACALVGRHGLFIMFLLIAGIPGALEVLAASGERAESALALDLSLARVRATLVPLAPLFLGVLAVPMAWRRRPAKAEEDGRLGQGRDALAHSFVHVAAAAALLSIGVALIVALPEENEYKFVRTGAVALAPLAALGWWALRSRAARAGLLAVWGGAALLAAVPGLASYAALAGLEAPLDEADGRLLPAGADPLAEVYAYLRDGEGERPVLVWNPPVAGAVGAPVAGYVFDGPANLQGASAAAFTGSALLADRESYLVNADPRWPARLNLLRALFAGVPEAVPALQATLSEPRLAGRPHFLLVRADELTAAIEEALGWREVFRSGDVRLLAPGLAEASER